LTLLFKNPVLWACERELYTHSVPSWFLTRICRVPISRSLGHFFCVVYLIKLSKTWLN